MKTYRRRYRRRPIKLFRRKYNKGRRTRRPNKFKQAQRSINKTNRYLKTHNKFTIHRPLNPNYIVRRFNQFTEFFYGTDVFYSSKGTASQDYLIQHIMAKQELDYYKSRFQYMCLLNFTVTFFISNTRNLTQLVDLATAQTTYMTTQTTNTHLNPELYIFHATSANLQSRYNAIDYSPVNRSGTIRRATQHPSFRRLSTDNKLIYKWHLPAAYANSYSETSQLVFNANLDTAFAGPLYDEPHGFVTTMPYYDSYPNSVNVGFTVCWRVDATVAFKDRIPTLAEP